MDFEYLHFDELDSTNSYIKERYSSLADHTFVSASFQSKGKGRGDHKWEAEKGENLLFSLLLKNPAEINRGGLLSLIPALAVCFELERLGIEGVKVKWPNDVYVGGRKIAGVLLEGRLPEFVCLGVGINLNQKDFACVSYPVKPTSVLLERGKGVDKEEFRVGLFNRILELLRASDQMLLKEYSNRDYLLGKNVSYEDSKGLQSATVLGVDGDFRLRVAQENREIALFSGEVKLVKDPI